MKVMWEDREFEFSLDDMDVQQAKVIKSHCGFTMLGLLEGLRQIDPDAVRAAFWLMHAQSGVPCDIDRVNFKIVDFADALNEATAAEQAIIAEANEGDPKETPDQ